MGPETSPSPGALYQLDTELMKHLPTFKSWLLLREHIQREGNFSYEDVISLTLIAENLAEELATQKSTATLLGPDPPKQGDSSNESHPR